MMENPELEIHMNAIMAIMKEYEPIMDGLDDAKEGEKEKSEMDTLARTINQQYNA